MKKIIDSDMNDNLYHEKLKNGMDVYILHKKMYYKTVANLTVKFGSIDDYLLDNNNNKMAIPMGTAHFLEHQMFENHSKKNSILFLLMVLKLTHLQILSLLVLV